MTTKSTNARKPTAGKQKTVAAPKNAGTGSGSVMQPGEIITVAEFIRRRGISRWTLAKMRNNGLKTRRDGNQVFVRYEDFAEYVAGLPAC